MWWIAYLQFLCWRWCRWLSPPYNCYALKKTNSEFQKFCLSFLKIRSFFFVRLLLTIFYADDDAVDLPLFTIFMLSKKLNSKFQILAFFYFRKFVIRVFFVKLCGEQLTYNFLCWRWRRWLAPPDLTRCRLLLCFLLVAVEFWL